MPAPLEKGSNIMTQHQQENVQQTLLDVEGMTCSSCVRHVEAALREVEGVRSVEVRLREGNVLVRHDAGSAPPEALVAALGEAGYGSVPRAAS